MVCHIARYEGSNKGWARYLMIKNVKRLRVNRFQSFSSMPCIDICILTGTIFVFFAQTFY